MDYRIFTLNKKTCIIHYPAKPNGFGVLWIGYFDGGHRRGRPSDSQQTEEIFNG